jgi:hypothetical protein
MAGSAQDPIQLDSDSDTEAIAVTPVAASPLSIALTIKESRVVPGQPGLFSAAAIPPNTFVTIYRWDRALTAHELESMPPARRSALERYAVAGPRDLTLVADPPLDARSGSAAAALRANEPLESGSANLALHAEVVAHGADLWYVVALYSCDAPIAANTELTWNYGTAYQPVRRREAYRPGRACTSREPLDPPLEALVATILTAQGAAGVHGILLRVEEESTDTKSDDSDYVELRRQAPQRRRVQPRRGGTSSMVDAVCDRHLARLRLVSRSDGVQETKCTFPTGF